MVTYTFNPSNVDVSNTDYLSAVRFLLGDTDVSGVNPPTADLSDQEITAVYSESSEYTGSVNGQAIRNVYTAYRLAAALQTKYRKQVTFSSAGTSVNLSDRARFWESVVQDLSSRLLSVLSQSAVTYPSRPRSYYP